MGQDPSDEELFDMIAEVDTDGSGEIGESARPRRPPVQAAELRFAPCPRLPRVPQSHQLAEEQAGQPGRRERHRRLRAPAGTVSSLHLLTLRLSCPVDAFIALGGNADKTGEISTDKLRGIVKEFGLTIDIDVNAQPCPCPPASPAPTPACPPCAQRLIRETDKDHSGFIDYPEFRDMMAE